MKTIPCFAAAAAFAVTAGIAFGAAETIYENDFAARRSAGPVGGSSSAAYAAIGVGFSSASSGVPHYLDAVGTAHTGAYSLKMSSWYRAEITVHLDADPKTFDYVLYEQLTGDPNGAPSMNAANGTQVFAVSGVEGMNGVSEISTLALFASRSAAFFDSIRIWHTPSGGSQETLVYKNSFTERTVWAKAAVLTGGDASTDSWRMLRTDLSGAFAFGGNPALAFDGGDNSSGQAGHPLGATLTSGEVVAQADIRAPRGWTANGGSSYVRLGGDGHLAAQDGYLTQVAAAFGFRCMTNVWANTWSGSLCTNSAIVAWNENALGGAGFVAAPATVTPGRWYRFVATARMRESLCDVAIYDMGEAQPTLETATPAAPVAAFSDLPFRTPKAALGGISCISASATTVRPNLLDPSSMPWFDNFRVVLNAQTATVLTIR